jgi:hypothetical protein
VSAEQAAVAAEAATLLGIPVGGISVAPPDSPGNLCPRGQLPLGQSTVMYRGRAASKLADQAALQPWQTFTRCPRENLSEPTRVHIDPLGYVELCQGIALGNLFVTPLPDLLDAHDAGDHPIVRPLLTGGPAALVREYDLAQLESFADACHLCDAARRLLRPRFPDQLAPDQMYGVVEAT